MDCGGGPGRYSTLLTSLGYRVTLLDISAASLKFAQRKAEDLALEIADYVHASVSIASIHAAFIIIPTIKQTIILDRYAAFLEWPTTVLLLSLREHRPQQYEFFPAGFGSSAMYRRPGFRPRAPTEAPAGNGAKPIYLHTSGHCAWSDIEGFVEKLRSGRVVHIRTEHVERFVERLPNVCLVE